MSTFPSGDDPGLESPFLHPGPVAPGLRERRIRAGGGDGTGDVDSAPMSRIDGHASAFPLRLAQAYAPARLDRAPRIAENPPASAPSMSGVGRLVAGRVDVPISFAGTGRLEATSTPSPRPSESLPFYVHPADKNSAATAVNVGRILDITA